MQWFVDADHREHYFTIAEQRPELHDQLRAIAVLDIVANNTDRKSGHCLLAPGWVDDDGAPLRVWAIDNGLCFATDFKLRTVIWEFAGEVAARRAGRRLLRRWSRPCPPTWPSCSTTTRSTALQRRAAWLAEHRVLPGDDSGHRYPWPLV